ncbi:MAG: hypothetical protein ASARMPRED_005038 [Alectoria sarmentosa]|nr:MAG: hypothetical protein ASARMPRED_005038 [Alectoria sarmentosa]
MRSSVFLFYSFVACIASLTKQDCGDDPKDCDVKSLPINTSQDPQDETEQIGIDQGLLDNLHFFSQFAAASYWPGNTNSTGDLLKCSGDSCPKVPAGNCPDVEKEKYMTISEWKDFAGFDDHGFIAISRSAKLIVLCFRGSGSNKNWAENLKMDKVHVPEFCKKCHVHHGFWESWRGVSEPVVKLLIRLHYENPNHRVVVVGHSLGGAEAVLAAGDIRNQGPWWTDNVELYSYGSPRVGNIETVRFLSKQSTKSYRVTAMQDPIPRMPPKFFGYKHTSPEYWIHSSPDHPGPDDVNIIWGYSNSKGVNQFSAVDGFHMNSHRHYFGYIPGCDPDPPTDPSVTEIRASL